MHFNARILILNQVHICNQCHLGIHEGLLYLREFIWMEGCILEMICAKEVGGLTYTGGLHLKVESFFNISACTI